MNQLLSAILPELILTCAACVLFLLGVVNRAGTRRSCAAIAFLVLLGICIWQMWSLFVGDPALVRDPSDVFHVHGFTNYIRILASGVGAILVLLAWPSD